MRVLALVLLVASCGGKLAVTDDTESDAAVAAVPTSRATDASAPDAPADANTCNTLVQQGPEVHGTDMQGPEGESVGGPIADGVYVLTSDVTYSANPNIGPVVDRVTLEVEGSTLNVVDTSDAGETRATFTFSTSEDLLHFTPTCVYGGMGDTFGNTWGWRYTATATALLELEGGRNVLRSSRTYTKQ